MTTELPIQFDDNGLVPAVIQDVDTDAVLMVGFVNTEALAKTRETGRVHYWSRSRAKLWKKGETSGHEQIVDSISVNCELNSLLIKVRQINAVCHDGYPTCFYRRLEDDNSLTTTAERWFDPRAVYGGEDQASMSLEALTRLWLAAYEHLKTNDFSNESGTSMRLRSVKPSCQPRIADELRELAGVLDGTHRHGAFASDVLLEGSQTLYWTVLVAVHAGIGWAELRPDRALATHEPSISTDSAARLLRAESANWPTNSTGARLAAELHAVLALVAQAASSARIDPGALVQRDLNELRTRPYLAEFFRHPPRT
ncbi:MAG: phosphoribosyl-AMP cyclohydrolase [Rhizobiales bacterium]|nr:phosphoribosyl-AMP cyclohydrolase [Hyphomicrobiales bacterium]